MLLALKSLSPCSFEATFLNHYTLRTPDAAYTFTIDKNNEHMNTTNLGRIHIPPKLVLF